MINHKKLLLSLLAVIFISNIWVLTSVWLNRSDVTSTVVLTERELRSSFYADEQNNGVSLALDYRVLSDEDEYAIYAGKPPGWLTTEKMQQLGFTDSQLDSKNTAHTDSKQVYIALELNGAAYKTSLAKTQARYDETYHSKDSIEDYIDDQLNRELYVNSRLFAIDADIEHSTLLRKYQSKENVFFVPGVIGISALYDQKGEEYRKGYIKSLAVADLYVPHPLNERLKDLKFREYDDFSSPRFKVEVKFGRQLIPWISDVQITPQSQN